MADKNQAPPVQENPAPTGSLARLRLGHANGNTTTVAFGYAPDHFDLGVLRDANHDQLNDHSKRQRNWMLSLPEDQQPYFTHIMEIDHLWPNHADYPPVWVSCPDHPALEQAVAEHFSDRGHTCRVGDPIEGLEDSFNAQQEG